MSVGDRRGLRICPVKRAIIPSDTEARTAETACAIVIESAFRNPFKPCRFLADHCNLFSWFAIID
jgi:hypothetical protein